MVFSQYHYPPWLHCPIKVREVKIVTEVLTRDVLSVAMFCIFQPCGAFLSKPGMSVFLTLL